MITSDWDNVMPMAWTQEAPHSQDPCDESGKDSVSVTAGALSEAREGR